MIVIVKLLKKYVPFFCFCLFLLLTVNSLVSASPSRRLELPIQQCAEGIELFFAGELEAALPLLEAGFTRREDAVFFSGDLGKCGLALGFLRHNLGDRQGALEAYSIALEMFQEGGEGWFEGLVLNNAGTIHQELGQYEEALTRFQEALTIMQRENDPMLESTALNNIGLVYHELGQIDNAWSYYQGALSLSRKIGDREGESSTLNNIGTLHRTVGEYEEALSAYYEALSILKALDNRLNEGITLNNIAQIHHDQGEYEQAIMVYKEALAIVQEEGDDMHISIALNNLGSVYIDQGEYKLAMDNFQEALVSADEASIPLSAALALNGIGEIHRRQGNFEDALAMFEEALMIVKEIDDGLNESVILNNIGLIYYARSQFERALAIYDEALTISKQIRDQVGESATLNNIAEVYRGQGQLQHALEAHQEALAIRQTIRARPEVGQSLGNIGLIYSAQGRYDEALTSLQDALIITKDVGDRAGEGTILGNIGTVYRVQGRMDQALMYYQDALAIHLEVGNLFDEGAAHNNIGVVYVALEQYEEGLDSLQQALGIARRLENRIGEGVVFHNIGHIYGAQGLTEEALANYQMALSIRHEVGDLYGESNSLNSIGTIYVDQGLHEEALTILEEALTIQQEVGDRLGESTTLSNIGFLYGQLGEFEAALEKIELAMDVLETVRSVAGSEEGRASFIAQYAGLYDSAISLYYQQEQVIEAFYSSERSRSRSFLDSMTTGQVELSDDETAVLRDREQAAYNHRRALQNALAEARSLDPPDPEWVAEVELQLAEAEAEYNEALAAIEERGDQLAALVSGRSTVLGLPEVQGLLPEGKTMVYYLVLEEQVLVFLITREGYEVVEIEATREEVTNRVGRWRGLIELRETEASLAEAQALYDLLIAPLSLNTPHLIIVPHGPLHYLPFAALLEAKTGQYLTEQFTLTTIPSASVLPFIQENAEGQGSRGAGEQGGMLVLGNPAVAGFGLEALPAAGREVETIAALYGAAALTGERATERTVWEQAGQSSVLHLAAHGEYNIYNPLYSTIYLAPDAAQPEGAVQPEGLNEKGNGRLEVHEIYGLNLQQTDLVVLSACQTQLGELSAGDELVGLTRAFFFAGTPSVIATLWNVDDEATAFLMERFYTHWREGMSKAAALRQAQIDTQAQPGYEDPFYWAGFVLSGDGGEVNEAETALMPATSSPVVVQEVAEVQEIEPEKTPAWVWWGLISLVLLTGSGGVVFWWFRRGRA